MPVMRPPKTNEERRYRRHLRVRKKVSGTTERPRLSVHFSGQHIYAQVIDDTIGKTLASANTTEKEFKSDKATAANVVNAVSPEGASREVWRKAFESLMPAVDAFAPDLIMISAGFDAHRRDPLAGMQVSEQGFAKLARVLLRVARDVCGNRLVAVLEGGYDLEALTRSVEAVLGEMSGESLEEAVSAPAGDVADLSLPLEIARHYWRI